MVQKVTPAQLTMDDILWGLPAQKPVFPPEEAMEQLHLRRRDDRFMHCVLTALECSGAPITQASAYATLACYQSDVIARLTKQMQELRCLDVGI